MKFLCIALLLVCSVFIFSCKKDKKQPDKPVEKVYLPVKMRHNITGTEITFEYNSSRLLTVFTEKVRNIDHRYRITYNTSNQAIRVDLDTNNTAKRKYLFDYKGNKLESSRLYVYENGVEKFYRKSTYEFNSKGHIVANNYFDEMDRLSSEVKFVRDDAGNILEISTTGVREKYTYDDKPGIFKNVNLNILEGLLADVYTIGAFNNALTKSYGSASSPLISQFFYNYNESGYPVNVKYPLEDGSFVITQTIEYIKL